MTAVPATDLNAVHDGDIQERPVLFLGVPAPALSRTILAVVVGGFCLVALLRIYSTSGVTAGEYAISGVLMVILAALQVLYFTRPVVGPQPPLRYAALLLQVGLIYVPLWFFKDNWNGLPGFLAGSILLVLPNPAAWVGFALVAISAGAAQENFTGAPEDVAYIAASTVITGLMIYGLTRLANTVVELQAARAELARMAVAQERLRFARDLHDLLGYSLSAITLKSELTRRLVLTHPVRAQDELVELLDISRRALADVRTVASGYRELSLETEARSARSVLLAADVDARIEIDHGDLPQHVGTLLATVLREGVTNVLRHSKAEHCEITVRRTGRTVTLDIVNDGTEDATLPDQVAGSEASAGVGGSGIGSLTARLAAVGGTLTAGPEPDGRWRLRAVVDVRAARA
jgi:two-component system sensor histidine kinase DesK